MKRLILFSALSALLCGHVPAQTVPALINYQGQLTDATGAPLPTADYVLTFSIHDAASGGTQVWGPQIFDGVAGQGHGAKIPVVQGYFNVMLGPVDTGGASIKDAFNATNRYVQIKVENNNAITPRQQILSAPFAVKAESAEKLTVPGANTPAVSVAGNANVGIGTTSPQSRLDVEGGDLLVSRGAVSSTDAGQVSISAYANFSSALRLGYFYNPGVEAAGVLQALDAGQPARLLLNPQGGAVGIGTTTPDLPLTLQTAGAADLFSWRNALGELGRLGSAGDATSGWLGLKSAGSYTVSLQATGPSYFKGGNVGIGTAAPASLLHAHGGNSDSVLRLESSGAGKQAGVWFQINSGASWRHFIGQETTVAGGLLTGDTARALVLGTDGPNPIQFGVNNQVVATMAAGGNVGIGKTQPLVKLDVAGDIATSRGGILTGVGWTRVPKAALGNLPFSPLSTVTWAVPGVVSADAKEVLVYVIARLGSGNSDNDIEFELYSEEGATRWSQYFYMHGYPQDAYSCNSQTFWLPVTPMRQVKCTSTGTALNGSGGGSAFIIGYR